MRRIILIMGALITFLICILTVRASTSDMGSRATIQGLRLQYADDGSLQAFADVSLTNIQATGVDFELKYDNRYLTPSEYNTNAPTHDAALMISENTAPFEKALEISGETHVFEFKMSQIFSDMVEVNLVPNPNLTKTGYITKVDAFMPKSKKLTALNIPNSNIQVITMSFKVTDTEIFLKLSEEELSKLLRVGSDAHYMYVNSEKIEYIDDIPLNVQVTVDTEHIPAKPPLPKIQTVIRGVTQTVAVDDSQAIVSLYKVANYAETRDENDLVKDIVTGKDGIFVFDDIQEEGIYSIAIRRPGYLPFYITNIVIEKSDKKLIYNFEEIDLFPGEIVATGDSRDIINQEDMDVFKKLTKKKNPKAGDLYGDDVLLYAKMLWSEPIETEPNLDEYKNKEVSYVTIGDFNATGEIDNRDKLIMTTHMKLYAPVFDNLNAPNRVPVEEYTSTTDGI